MLARLARSNRIFHVVGIAIDAVRCPHQIQRDRRENHTNPCLVVDRAMTAFSCLAGIEA